MTDSGVPHLESFGSQQPKRLYPLTLEQIVIGRKTDADIVLSHPSVSRHHARLVRTGPSYLLLDLNSSHGTYVNGQRIVQHPLQPGDKIRLGEDGLELVYCLGPSSAAETSETWVTGDLEQSLQSLASILPARDTGYSDLEKISCILDFHYYCGRSFSPENTFQQILRAALQISGAERGFILLRQPGGFRYAAGLDAQGRPLPQSHFETSQTVVGQVAAEGRPVIMMEKIAGDLAQRESILAMHLTAVACLPLEGISTRSDASEVLGILYLDSTRSMHVLSGLDEKILAKLAEDAGTVLEKLEMVKRLEERKVMEQELALAQETQRSLLPRALPQFENFRIQAYCHPTRHVGGDFYDFLLLDSGELAGVLADVSGKGISAALLSSLVQGALNMEFRSTLHAEQVLNQINKFLCEKTAANRFVTLFLFLLDSSGAGRFLGAGHTPSYLFRRASAEIEELLSGGMILGAFDFASYEACPFQLEAGDVLLVYSDGLTEAEDPDGEMFGEERLREVLRREAHAGSEALQGKLLEALQQFTRGFAQTDDITFLLIEKVQ